ncbi:hypothetical protein BDW60DRAFT_44055 [Aspergillus nidulans var. acristatus]
MALPLRLTPRNVVLSKCAQITCISSRIKGIVAAAQAYSELGLTQTVDRLRSALFFVVIVRHRLAAYQEAPPEHPRHLRYPYPPFFRRLVRILTTCPYPYPHRKVHRSTSVSTMYCTLSPFASTNAYIPRNRREGESNNLGSRVLHILIPLTF